MRALVIDDGKLRVEERPTPTPEADQVLVDVASAGLNRADTMQARGLYPAPPGWPPDVPGLEFAGTVAATGRGVKALNEGDRVLGIVGGGAHATHLITKEDLCSRLSDELDMVAAGGIPEAFITAHDALVTQGDLRPGQRVLIHGVGSGVGTAAVQVARLLGATTVGTSRTEAKLLKAEELGLDQGVLASESMADEIGEVDVVIDLIGGDYLATDVEVCRVRGRIVIVGLLAGARTTLNLAAVLSKRLTIRGTTLRARPDYEKALAARAFEREVLPSLQHGDTQVVVDNVFMLDDAAAAYEYMLSNEGYGKTIIDCRGGLGRTAE
ncbi:MAG TPA: NAD(P)H-quinone oxidoreductase [Actinomycetota bacterium]|nr:NAD(P)H-quinone oxidoreductase [Actinomycetota bacterium]